VHRFHIRVSSRGSGVERIVEFTRGVRAIEPRLEYEVSE